MLVVFAAAPLATAQNPWSAAALQQRLRSFLAQRSTADRATPAAARQNAQSQHAALLQRQAVRAHGGSTPLTAPWQPLGPSSVISQNFGNITGRVTAIAFDPNDTSGNTVYLGTTGGGVWKSTNAAGALAFITFTPLTDTLSVFNINAGASTLPSLSIGAVAVQPAANPVVLAGTGDPNDASDSLYGEGILRSTDGGQTWTVSTLAQNNGTHYSFAGLATAAIAFSTTSPQLVVAAMSVSPQSATVDAAGSSSIPGLYYSPDAGVTWYMSSIYDGAQVVQTPQPLGTGQIGNAATSVVWDARRNLFVAAVRSHGYYSSPDGITWTRLTLQPGAGLTTANCPVGSNGQGSANCPILRGTLAVQPVTGDLYALTVDVNDNDQGLWQDLCNAASGSCASPSPSWSGGRIDNRALEVGSGSIAQGSYNLSLAAAASPDGGTLLFVGTVDLYRCAIAAGSSTCALRNTTNALNGCNAPAKVAPAQHAIAAELTTGSELVLIGNDGGLWRSPDGVNQSGAACSASDAQHFDNLNSAIGAGGSLAEVVGFAQDPANPDILLAGLGADGSAATTDAATLAAWPQLSSGEGGLPHIDPNNPSNWLVTIGAGVNLKTCTSGLDCTAADLLPPATIGATQVNNDAALFEASSLLDSPENVPQQTTGLLIGTCRVWRGTASDGSTWSTANELSPAFDGTGGPCLPSSGMVRSLAAGGPVADTGDPQSSGSTVLYAGIAGLLDGGGGIAGHLFVTTSANTASSATAWTDATHGSVTNDLGDAHVFNPDGFDISSIAVDPHDTTGATVYATVMGFGTVPHLYRSSDFGQHWLNISSNLPLAPANAVVVDPNDASTVYVAMDTGVFETQSVTTCATMNCWSPLGTGLPNAPATTLEAAPQMPTGDGRLGMLRAGTYGRGLWQIPLLNATTINAPAITLSPASLTFPVQAVATQSSAQTVTVASVGNQPVTFGLPVIGGDFVETDNCSGQTLPVGATCTFSVSFAPTQTGTRGGTLTIHANIPGGQATVSLSGIAAPAAAVVLTPLTLTFPATIVNQTASAQIITVANTGANAVSLNSPAITGDFAIAASTCGATLASQTACSLSISFTPSAGGTRTGVLTVTDSAGTQTAQLTGTGNAPATDTLTSASLTFAQQAIGTTSAAQQVTLINSGDVALTLITASVSPGDFTATNSCGASLNPHSSCAISVAFAPTTIGVRTATLTVTDQFRSQAVPLTGTGVAPPGVSLSPASLIFPAIGVGFSSPAQTLTLTNNGGLALHISNMAMSAGFQIASSTCGSTLASASSCNLVVVFTPTAAGAVNGTLTLTDDAPSGSQTTNLAAVGIDYTLATSSASSVTLSSGATANYSLLLSSLQGLSGTVAFACSGAPANSTCTVNPATANLGGSYTISATVQTGQSQTTSALANPRPLGSRGVPVLALLFAMPLAFLRRRRRLTRFMLPILLFATFTGLCGCGSARIIPGNDTGGGGSSSATPPGTYSLTVSASAAGLTHSVNLTLVVQ